MAIRANAFSGRRIVYSQNKDLVQSGTLFRGRSSIQKNNHEGVTTNCSGSQTAAQTRPKSHYLRVATDSVNLLQRKPITNIIIDHVRDSEKQTLIREEEVNYI